MKTLLKNRKKHETEIALLFLAPSFGGLVVFWFAPFALTVYRSFTDVLGKRGVGFSNYRSVLENSTFQLAAVNTLRFLVVCLPLLLCVSLVLAICVRALHPEGRRFKTTFLLPMALPVASMVILWKALFSENGLLNDLLTALDFHPVDFMGTDAAFWILVVTYLWKNGGYDMILWLAGLTVVSLLCKEGEKVTAGQSILQLDSDEIALTLEREKAELYKLQVQKSQLQDTQEPDASAVSSAQQQLNWAYEDQEKARQTLENLQKAETSDEQAIAKAQQEYESAVRAAQSTENVRNSALAAYEEQKLQNEKSAAANQADAAVLQVGIKEKMQTIEELSSLQAAGGTISAPRAGTLLSWNLTEGSASGAQACTIADAEQGYEMNFSLSGDSAQKVQFGAQVQVTQDSQTEIATITALSTANEDGSIDVTVRLTGQQWFQGTARGKLLLSQTEHDLCVPTQAVHSDNRGTFVYVLEERETVLGIQNVLMRVPVAVVETGRMLTAVSSAMLETARWLFPVQSRCRKVQVSRWWNHEAESH